MKEEWSTFEVCRIFEIKRNRLQEWLDGRAGGRPFFVPSRLADGRGTRAVFNRNDLYRLRLFTLLVERGHSREEAREDSDVDFSNVGPGRDQLKFGVIAAGKERGGFKSGRMKLEKVWREPTGDYPLLVYIDLRAIKAEVDRLVGE